MERGNLDFLMEKKYLEDSRMTNFNLEIELYY
jgi:hypothetical protein